MVSGANPVLTEVVRGLENLLYEQRLRELALAGLEEKAKKGGGCCSPLQSQGNEEARSQILPAVHRGKRKRGHCQKLQQRQLELPREGIPHHGKCKAPEQTPARLWLCEELSWAWTPAACSDCGFLTEAKQGDSRVPSKLIFL